MCNQEHLISYLYDDLSPEDRRTFEAHLVQCAGCRQEIAGLRQTRHHLAAWAPPEPAVNFRVVRSARPSPSRRRLAFMPQWGLAAAAALLVMAGAAALANLEMRYGPEGFVVRTGWGAAPSSQIPAATTPSPGAVSTGAPTPVNAGASEELMEAVSLLTRRVQELEQLQTSQVSRAGAAPRPGISAPELRKILAESETRQRMEMALRIEQVWKDFNAARANDFARVQQTVGPELRRQQRMIENVSNVVYRTTQK